MIPECGTKLDFKRCALDVVNVSFCERCKRAFPLRVEKGEWLHATGWCLDCQRQWDYEWNRANMLNQVLKVERLFIEYRKQFAADSERGRLFIEYRK